MDLYIALMRKPDEQTPNWRVTFPDFPECEAAGGSYGEAFSNAGDALAEHVAAMVANGEQAPPPSNMDVSSLARVFAAEIAEGILPTFVWLKEVAAPKERINIMIDRTILRLVDDAARASRVSRSAFLETAAADKLQIPVRSLSRGI